MLFSPVWDLAKSRGCKNFKALSWAVSTLNNFKGKPYEKSFFFKFNLNNNLKSTFWLNLAQPWIKNFLKKLAFLTKLSWTRIGNFLDSFLKKFSSVLSEFEHFKIQKVRRAKNLTGWLFLSSKIRLIIFQAGKPGDWLTAQELVLVLNSNHSDWRC